MYTSIIYDRGWKAYIDGKEVEISSINEALLAIPVPAGTDTIDLKYCPENLVSGLVITIISIGLLTFLIIWDKKKKKAVADDTTEETDEIDELDDNTDESIIESENEAIEETNAPNKENE